MLIKASTLRVVGVILATLLFLNPPALLAAPGDAPIGGQIFIDFDRDGEIDTGEQLPDSDAAYPPGGIDVVVYDSAGNSVNGVVTSTAAGVSWTANVTSLVGSDFRVEFELDPADEAAGWSDSFIGPDHDSAVTFASAGDTAVSFGFIPPSVCSGGEGQLWTTCFVNGWATSGGPTDVIVEMDYGLTAPQSIGEKLDYGSVWGLAYDEYSGILYSSAFLKRGSDLGPEGLDGLYWSDGAGAGAGSIGLDSLSTVTYGVDPINRDLGEYNNQDPDADPNVFGLIGKTGIGDIDVTPDGRTLLVTNLETNEVDVYDVTAVATGGNPVYVRSIAIANPGCSDGDYRIFAINAIDADTALTGVTCTAQTSQDTADLEAHAVEFNISGAGTSTSLLTVPLDYTRGCAIYNSTTGFCRGNSGETDGNYNPWSDDPNDADSAAQFMVLEQPMLTDLEIAEDGDLVLGFADRYGHQQVYGTAQTTGLNVVSGELLHACNTSGDPDNPTWVLEGDAACPGNFANPAGTPPTIGQSHYGPGGETEFYGEENLYVARSGGGHAETTNGGLYIRPGSGEVVVSIMDPLTTISGGLSIFDTTTGATTNEVELYRGVQSAGYLGKAAGIGDVEGCFLPVGLGDYVWLDADQDGIQDPGEQPLAGVTVTITGGSLSAPVTLTTDANGQWEATYLDGLVEGESYTITIDPSTVSNLPAGLTVADIFPTTQDSGTNDANDSDLDAGTFTITTAPLAPGEVNHTYDAGFSADIYDLALTKVYASDTYGDTTDGIIDIGTDVTFTVTVYNQGNVDATDFRVFDYIPAGFTLVEDANWEAISGNRGRYISSAVLAAGDSIDIPITMTATSAAAGDHVNWAEISLDDGDDVDSTPDADIANDNQPTGPGEPTDNVIDNSAGDEDDHDPAGVTLGAFDLALIKTLATGQASVIEPGDDVTFTITVTNQGTLDATSFEVTDYLPVGFSLNDADWTDNNDGTATYTGGALAAGVSEEIDITLTADANITPGDFVNWAEISSDSGADVDSTPDATQGNDSQPAGPGEPTDDVVDNTGGDEDDHDPAGVTVEVFDLALIKTLATGQAGVITPGDDVDFTITVTNQGSVDATSFEVTDYIPAGFSLNDAAWTAGAGNTATITGGPLAAGASTPIDITLTADANITPGDFVNWAEISDDSGDDIDSTTDATQGNDDQPTGPGAAGDDVVNNAGGDEDDHDPAGVTVEVFDLALIKTLATGQASTIIPGDDVDFTITVTNQGSVDAASFEVTDYLPAGFSLNDAAWTAGAGNTATFTGGPLAAGVSTTIDITLTADANITPGDFVNWAEISDDSGDDIDSTTDTTQGNDSQPAGPGEPTDDVVDNTAGDEDDHDPAGVTVEPTPIYDLALIKTLATGQASVITPGDDVTFTITVTNQGTIDAQRFNVLDYVPAGFTFEVAANPGWDINGAGLPRFVNGPLAAGDSVDIDITLTADANIAPGEFVNWAEIGFDDGNDVDSTTDNIQGNDNQPAGPGEPTDDVVDNTGGDEDDHDPAGVTVEIFDLALIKTLATGQDTVIAPGDDVTFTITVTNQGSVDATSFEVTDYLPTGFTLNDAAWTVGAGNTATITGGPLAAGASTTIDITLTAGTATGDFVNWAEISDDSGDDIDSTTDATQGNDDQPTGPGAPGDDVVDNTGGDEDDHDPAGVSVEFYDLALIKVYTSDTFGATADGIIEEGADVTFTITVINQGTIDATTFEVTDYIPAGFSLNDAAWTDNGSTATFDGGPLAAGASVDIDITLTADSVSPGSFVNWAEISDDDGDDVDSITDATQGNDDQPTAPGQPGDDVIDNTGGDEDDHDPAGVAVANYDLALIKTLAAGQDTVIEPGDDVTFTITVTNQGTLDATTFEVTDYLPAGFTLNDTDWTDNGTTASIDAGPLAAGASTDIDITLTAGAATGDFVNWAEISNDDGNDVDSTTDATQGNDDQPTAPGQPGDDVIDNTGGDEDDHDPAPITVEVYDLALTKAYTSDSFGDSTDGIIQPGTDVTFTITVTNQGTLDAATFEVTDYLPTGFSLNDGAWADNGTTATYTGGALAAGASIDIPITLTAGTTTGDFVNWAEISDDDGNDVDSTTDATQGNDNQPAAPGDPTDDEINNASGDEDDHDPAPISVEVYDLALTKAYTSDSFGAPTDGVIEAGTDVTFTIMVINQGTVDAASFEVTDYIPAGFSLNDGAWTDNGTTATYAGRPLAAGASVDIPITLTADSVSPGSYVNWAEISSDDGIDIDSTTDVVQANDNQPIAPGDPTDDVIDNTAGDEDDHDPAGVSVANFDLALTKAYTSDTYGASTDGVIENGADVTFTITVINQGTIEATSFEVTDYLPAGFSLNDGAWTDNGDGTATTTGGPLAAGASTDIEITLTADAASTGESVNLAEISTDDGNDVDSTPDDDPADDDQPAAPGDPTDDEVNNTDGDEDDHDIAGVSVEVYDLALQKVYTSDSFGDATDAVIDTGADVTFTITITNQGTAADAASFLVTDYLPAGFTLNDAAWTDNGDGTASIAGGPLAAGASTDIDITMTAGVVAPGSYVNYAEISGDDGNDADSTPNTDPDDDAQPSSPGDPTDDVIDNTSGDEDDHDLAGVGVENFDLALIKMMSDDGFGDPADGLTEVGSDVTFTITVINQGTIDAGTFDVTDYLPAGFTLNDAAWTDNGDGTATIAGGPLAAGESVAIPIVMTIDTAPVGQAMNLAEISSDDGTDIDSTPNADPGDDNQPAAPGDPTDDITNGASGDEDDHDIAGVSIGEFDLALTKVYTSDTSADGNATDGAIQQGDDVTFTITVINQGTLDAATFDVTDYMPAGFVLNDAAWTDNGDGTATITEGPLAAGASMDIEITMTADDVSAGQLVNGAEISTDDATDIDSTPDADPADDAQPTAPGDPTDDVVDNTDGDEDDHDIAGVVIDVYDLAIAKAFMSDTSADGNSTDGVIQPGDDATFTITVTNQGTIDAAAVSITDYIPTGFVLSATSPDSDGWTDNGNGTATTSVGAIPAGGSVDVTITITAVDTGAGALINVVEISSDDGLDVDSTPDTDPDNEGGPGGEDDIDDAPLTVDAYDLALRKVFTSDTSVDGNSTDGVIAAGDDITFTITVFNQGTVDAADIEVTDFMPAGFVLNDSAWSDNGDGTATMSVGAVAAGDSVDVTITLTAVSPILGDNLNAAEISDDDGNDIDSDPNAVVTDDGPVTDDEIDNANGDEDDHDPAPFTVVEEIVPVFDLALRKTLADGTNTATVAVGDPITFTITVFNQGEVNAANIDVIDYIPSGLELADSDWTETTAGDGMITIPGPIAPGASASVDITTTVVDGSDLTNLAEIASADPVDENGVVLVLSDGTVVPDVDSVADALNGEVAVDDEINNTDGDEDDHDIATLALATAVTPTVPLAVTGTMWTSVLLYWSLGLFFLGAALVLFARKPEEELVARINERRNR